MTKTNKSNRRGWQIALQLIEREAKEQIGILDLETLGLTELPDQLFDLKYLVNLNLEREYLGTENEAINTSNSLGTNRISNSLTNLAKLPNLKSLSLSGMPMESLKGINNFRISHLNINNTLVRDFHRLTEFLGLEISFRR